MPESYDFSIHDNESYERLLCMLRYLWKEHMLRVGMEGQRQCALAFADLLGDTMGAAEAADPGYGEAFQQAVLGHMERTKRRALEMIAADGMGAVSRG